MRCTGTDLLNAHDLLIRGGLRGGDWLGDFGCGAFGHFVFSGATIVGGIGRVYAIDVQRMAIQTIHRVARQEQAWHVHPVWADIESSVPIPSASLDVTLIANTFSLLHNRDGFVEEAARVTKPGGRVLMIEWHKRASLLGPHADERISPEELHLLMAHPELELFDRFDAGDEHYAMVFERLSSNAEPMVISHSQARITH